MKKFLTIFTIATMCNIVANAQTESASAPKNEIKKERFEKASPEQKQRMMEMKKKFDALTPEQKEAVKKERERHHQEMKKITGFEDMMPPMPGREDNFKERK